MNKKILYIEFGTSHTEIIHSFCKALSPENHIYLIINEKSKSRIQSSDLIEKIDFVAENLLFEHVLKTIKIYQPDLILLNSAQGKLIRNLCMRLLFNQIPIVGIHHNPQNIYASFTQKIIHWKIKKYIVLADFIKKFIKQKNPRIQIESFYPVYYPACEKVKLDEDLCYISIPGVLENDRRDYLGLVDLVAQNHQTISPQVRFVCLGSALTHNGPEIVAKVKALGLQNRFIFFDHYIEDSVLLSYVQQSVAVMPLLHPGTRWFEQYFETKISGAYSLAFAFKKKLLMHAIFSDKEEFSSRGVFYDPHDFAQVINGLIDSLSVNSVDELAEIKFDLHFQKKKLQQFLLS